MEKKKDNRGGARPGAGRPKGDSRMISFRAPGALADSLEQMDNRTDFIRRSLSKAIREQESDSAAMEKRPHAEMQGQEPAAMGKWTPTGNRERASAAMGERFPASMGEWIPAGRVPGLALPFFDQRVVAGFPVPLDNDERSQDIDILTMLCPHPEASYLIRVSGDSMIDAGILSGDIVIVDKSNRNPSPKEIAVCELNGEFTLKHFVKEGNQGWLVPANPDYPRFPITQDDEFSVWGTVTYIIHKARD